MVQRFTAEARAVVVHAGAQARRLGHRHIGTEHILLSLLSTEGLTSAVFAEAGVTIETAELGLGPSGDESDGTLESDRDALADLGIDLGRIQDIVESVFGQRALDRARSSRAHRRWRRRNRHCAYGFTEASKRAIEVSMREAERLKHIAIGPEHIALALLHAEESLAHRILSRQGVAMRSLQRLLEHVPGRAA